MTLLDFARGPAMQWSLTILIVGVIWRLLGVLLLARAVDLSAPRNAFANIRGSRTIFSRAWPHPEFLTGTRYQTILAYVFHIGLFIVIFGITPHIEFIKGLTGISWAGLPNSVGLGVGAVSLVALVAMLFRRLTNPEQCCSNWNDYFSWLVTVAPLVTGLMAFLHIGPRYETMLALHILSIAVLFIWFPFGKLMHAFWFLFSRAQSGIAYYRKGVRI